MSDDKVYLSYCPRLASSLSLHPLEIEGKPYFHITDLRHIASSPLIVPQPLMGVLSRFDGLHSLEEILKEFFPYGLEERVLFQLFVDLERMMFLETASREQRWNALKLEYRQSAERPVSHAGAVYPESEGELASFLDNLRKRSKEVVVQSQDWESRLTDNGSYGLDVAAKFPSRGGSPHRGFAPQTEVGTVRGVISPHIDYRRGYASYGVVSEMLRKLPSPDLILLVGTCHSAMDGFAVLSDKDYLFPGGNLSGRIVREYNFPEWVFAEEILHAKEHSLELQLPLIGDAWNSQPCICPLLVGSLHESIFEKTEPASSHPFYDWVKLLAEFIDGLENSGVNLFLYLGVDLAHMGRHFGDTQSLQPKDRKFIAEEDLEFLQLVLHGSASEVFKHVARDGDRRRICGFSSLYFMKKVFEQRGCQFGGDILDYRQSYDAGEDCLVTFAASSLSW
ncbi:MAG: AmmeMemoRadiSam system protein B [bacterium]|nr:AmmeMemoRadiSam system protein B [bacterium]